MNSIVTMVPKAYPHTVDSSTNKAFLDGLTPPTKTKTLRNDYEQSYIIKNEEVPLLNIGTTPSSQANDLINSLPTPTDNYTVKCTINNDGITLDNTVESPSQNINKAVEIMIPISPKEEISKHPNGKSISSNATLVSSKASYPSPQSINKRNILSGNSTYNDIQLLKQQPLTEEPVQFYNNNLITNQNIIKSSTMNSDKTIIANTTTSPASSSCVPNRIISTNNKKSNIQIINKNIPISVIPNSSKNTITMNNDVTNNLTMTRQILNKKPISMTEPIRFAEPVSINEPLSFTEPITFVEPINEVDSPFKRPIRENKGKSQYVNNIMKTQKSKSKTLTEILKDPSVQNRSYAFIDFLLENAGSANFLKSASRVNNFNKSKNKGGSKLKSFFTDGLGKDDILTLDDFLEADKLNKSLDNANSSTKINEETSLSNQKLNISCSPITGSNDNKNNVTIKSSEQSLLKNKTNELNTQSLFNAIDLNDELLKDRKESEKITKEVNSLTDFIKSNIMLTLNKNNELISKENKTKPENEIKNVENQNKIEKENKKEQNKKQKKEQKEEQKIDQIINQTIDQKKDLRKDQKKESKKVLKKEQKKEQKKELKKEQKKELKKGQKKEKKEQKKEEMNDAIKKEESNITKRKLNENVEKVASKKRKNEEKMKENIKMEVNEIKNETQKKDSSTNEDIQKSKKRPNDTNDITSNDKPPKKKKVSKESGEKKRRTVKEEIEDGIMSKVKYNSNNISLYASELKTLLKYQTKEDKEVYPLRCIYEGDLEEKEYGLEDLICTYPDCNKVFSKSIHLEKHFAEHGEDFRPFQCPNCTKNFRRRYDLMRHSRIHNYIIPYRCSRCLRGFTRSDSCARHTKTRQCKYYDFSTIEMKKSQPPFYTVIKDPVAKSENKIIIVPLTKEKN